MKTQIKIAAMAIGMMLAEQAKAQDFQPSTSIETDTYKAQVKAIYGTFKLHVYLGRHGKNADDLQISIKDSRGNSLYAENIDKYQKQVAIYFDLTTLKDDAYSLEISDKSGKNIKKFYKEISKLVRIEGQLVALN